MGPTMTAGQEAGKVNTSQRSSPMVIGSLMAALLMTVVAVAPGVRAECQTNQTVSGEEICQDDDDTNGAYNLMER
ncbi:MAG: hypothetical protein ISQ52_08570 [Synechococcus sp. BS307-5m-G38]|jgi:hypothetical protein|nr:hypothetical protein [Cyanobium sp. MED843]MBL6803134.1 hypothetical protein [Synechococcus sp. BS307-5m-G38]OUW27412.1 MAG: hypothetical protein CBD37_07265 [Cyanobacteria bacterium TMED177]